MKVVLVCLAILLSQVIILNAQTAQGRLIRGIVRDVNGAVIVGACIELRAPQRDAVVLTDDEGNFSFSDVPDGRYVLQVSAEGFSGVEKAVDADAGAVVHDITLEIGKPRWGLYAYAVYDGSSPTSLA